jgi:uncharacterized membrane protein YqgA involved in biofilm formation
MIITATIVLILGVILICIGAELIDACYYEIIPAITISVGIVLTAGGSICLLTRGVNQVSQQTETYCTCAVKEVKYCEKCGNIIIEEETP